jgi:hypothetical protein
VPGIRTLSGDGRLVQQALAKAQAKADRRRPALTEEAFPERRAATFAVFLGDDLLQVLAADIENRPDLGRVPAWIDESFQLWVVKQSALFRSSTHRFAHR